MQIDVTSILKATAPKARRFPSIRSRIYATRGPLNARAFDRFVEWCKIHVENTQRSDGPASDWPGSAGARAEWNARRALSAAEARADAPLLVRPGPVGHVGPLAFSKAGR